LSLKRNGVSILVLGLIGLVVLGGLTYFNYQYSEQSPGGNDFLARWIGANYWIKQGMSPYDDRVGLGAQKMIYGHAADVTKGEDLNLFVYPLFSMIFFAPFGMMKYTLARAVWMTLLEICLVVVTFLCLRLSRWKLNLPGMAVALLFSIFWYFGARTLILGQFAGIEAVLILGALVLILDKHDMNAGLLLALSLCKPQMSFLIVIFAFLWGISTHRPKISLGIIGGFAFLMVSSMVFLPDWPVQWLRQMIQYPSYTDRIGSVVSVISGSMPGISNVLSLILYGIFGLYLLTEWILAWGRDENWFLWTSLMTLVITNFVAFRTATPHYIVLMAVIFLVFRVWKERWGKPGQRAAWVTIFILFAGFWALFLGTVQGNLEHPVMYLPLPFLCMIGLWWVRWWMIRPPKVFFDQYNF
jgi:hypothetical protein